MRFKQVIVSVLYVICLCGGFSSTASAQTVAEYPLVHCVSPLYDIAISVSSELNIVETKAECVSRALGDNTVKITAEQTLQKYSGWFWIWDDVDDASWSKTVNDGSIRLSNTKSYLTNGNYRVKSVFILTDTDGKTETITVYSDEKSVN